MLIKNVDVLLPEGRFQRCDLRFEQRILELGALPGEGVDGAGAILLPGLIDAHTHGAAGAGFCGDAAPDMEKLARFYARHGVTGFFATTLSLPEAVLTETLREIARFQPAEDGASCLGVHLEGPFLSAARRGIHRADCLLDPDLALFSRIDRAAGGRVRRVTLAPELSGALPFIETISPRCAVSLGHSGADYQTALSAFAAGANQLTHLFNGMQPFHHRAPGLIGAAMDAGAYAEVIADGVHLHPSAVRAAFRLFPGRVMLISDSLPCAGLPEGAYTVGGQPLLVENGRCVQRESGVLAGSLTTLHECLVKAVRFGVAPEEAAAACTMIPARALGLDAERGVICPGRRADLALLNPDWSLRAVYVGGVPVGI